MRAPARRRIRRGRKGWRWSRSSPVHLLRSNRRKVKCFGCITRGSCCEAHIFKLLFIIPIKAASPFYIFWTLCCNSLLALNHPLLQLYLHINNSSILVRNLKLPFYSIVMHFYILFRLFVNFINNVDSEIWNNYVTYVTGNILMWKMLPVARITLFLTGVNDISIFKILELIIVWGENYIELTNRQKSIEGSKRIDRNNNDQPNTK